jgi:hypothetical protein
LKQFEPFSKAFLKINEANFRESVKITEQERTAAVTTKKPLSTVNKKTGRSRK